MCTISLFRWIEKSHRLWHSNVYKGKLTPPVAQQTWSGGWVDREVTPPVVQQCLYEEKFTPPVAQQTLVSNATGNRSGKSQLVDKILTLLWQVLVRGATGMRQ